MVEGTFLTWVRSARVKQVLLAHYEPMLKNIPSTGSSSFPTGCSKVVPLLEFFFVCASVVVFVAFVLSLF